MKIANPQGKGTLAVLADLESTRLQSHACSNLPNLLARYVISRVILCAEFHFKPIAEKRYYLYIKDRQLKLSLISPEQWKDGRFGDFLASCEQAQDMTWSLFDMQEGQVIYLFKEIISTLRGDLLADLAEHKPLAETLPSYDSRLNYHRRIAANSLAYTMAHQLGELASKPLFQLAQEHGVELPLLGSPD